MATKKKPKVSSGVAGIFYLNNNMWKNIVFVLQWQGTPIREIVSRLKAQKLSDKFILKLMPEAKHIIAQQAKKKRPFR